jgi:hypothetical protein
MDRIEVGELVVRTERTAHPLLGEAQIIEHAGAPITAMSAIEWACPTEIPTIAEPRKLPRGAGSLLMNEIAIRAQRAGVQTLRYAGPYPTYNLFQSLLRSFRTEGSDTEFAADVLQRALQLSHTEIPIDFTPAPFERHPTTYGFADTRDGSLDRVSIDGVLYDEDGSPGSIARLDPEIADGSPSGGGWSAVLGIGSQCRLAEIATLDAQGTLLAGPHPIPALDAPDIIGRSFPVELREQYAELVIPFVPAPLHADVRAVIVAREIEWADLGWRAAIATERGFALHAAHWTLVAQRDRRHFLLTTAHRLADIVQQTILDELTR